MYVLSIEAALTGTVSGKKSDGFVLLFQDSAGQNELSIDVVVLKSDQAKLSLLANGDSVALEGAVYLASKNRFTLVAHSLRRVREYSRTVKNSVLVKGRDLKSLNYSACTDNLFHAYISGNRFNFMVDRVMLGQAGIKRLMRDPRTVTLFGSFENQGAALGRDLTNPDQIMFVADELRTGELSLNSSIRNACRLNQIYKTMLGLSA